MINYDTISEAVDSLKKRGYNIDFNQRFNGIDPHTSLYSLASDKFEISEVHRFEGFTDPDDEEVLYVIESKEGLNGFLVNGYGISSDPYLDEIIKELAIRH